MEIESKNIDDIVPYENNPRNNDEAADYVAKSIIEFGFKNPIIIDKDNVIVAGHTRLKAAKKLGLKNVPCIRADDLTDDQIKAYRLADNKVSELATWDTEKLNIELQEINLNMLDFGFSDFELEDLTLEEEKEITEDEIPDVPEEPKAKYGEIYQLGNHRIMCGDSTKEEDIKKLMNGVKANLVFTDPPYGMKKENDGVLNDNLNFKDLLMFNKKWIPLSFANLKDNGSWYCWGIDEPLMDIYSEILKPMIQENKITFRNLITWFKGCVQGQLSEGFRSYPIADEKCLFVMCGVQGFNNNSDNYYDGWEPIRLYLLEQRQKCGWDIPTMKKIAGHSDKSPDHWTSKSQWSLLTEEVYRKFQNWANEHNIDAFKRDYKDIRKEYEEIKLEFDRIKQGYYGSRAYFNNTHDNMNNVWVYESNPFGETRNQFLEEIQQAAGHPTPKPLALCSRAIKSSSRENEIVLDMFGGSGSTLIACEQLGRACYVMELAPKYVDVIIERWERLTGQKAVKIETV